MDDFLEVLNNPVNTGGSGSGCSYYQQVLRCPRRAHLNRERHEDAGQAANTGTAFHKLMEWYYGGQSKEALAIEVGDVSDGSPQEKALNMFRHYTKQCPPDFFGRVVGVEVQLPDDRSKEQMELLAETMGIAPWTGRIDMVVEGKWEGEEGLYLVDFKTSSRRNSMAGMQYRNSLQAHSYMMAWDALHTEQKCSGMIFQCVTSSTTKKAGTTVSLDHYFVAPPGPKDRLMVQQQLSLAKAFDDSDLCFVTDCYSFHRECPYLGVECDRTMQENE